MKGISKIKKISNYFINKISNKKSYKNKQHFNLNYSKITQKKSLITLFYEEFSDPELIVH